MNPSTAVQHGERAHADFPPSGSKMWLECGQWYKRTSHLPDGGNSPAAAWGTAAHEKAEKCLKARTRLPKTDEHALVVNAYVDHVLERLAAYPGAKLFVETRVDVIGPHCWGSIDAAIVDELLCIVEVIDLKAGRGIVVEAEGNTQCAIYGAGLLYKVSPDEKTWPDWKIVLTIVQPRAFDEPQHWHVEGATVVELVKKAKKAIKRHLDPKDTTPGKTGDHCTFCKAKPTCPDQLATAGEVFGDLPVAVETGSPLQMPPEPAQLTQAQLASVLSFKPQILAWLASVEAHALHSPPPGFKVVEGRANRKWKDEAQVVGTLEMLGVDPYAKTLRGITDIENELGGGVKAKKLIADIVMKPPGKPKLTTADDPRPAIDAASVFPDDEETSDAT